MEIKTSSYEKRTQEFIKFNWNTIELRIQKT